MSDIYEPTRPDERTKSSWLADRDSIPETPPYWLRYSGEGRPQIRGGRVVEIEVDGREKGGDVRL